jgi:MFS family permease
MSEAGFSAAWTSLAGGVFLAGFAVELHASNVAQGFLAALPFLAGVAQLAGAYLVEQRGVRRRSVALAGLFASRLLFLAVIPAVWWLLPGRPGAALTIYLVFAAGAYLLQGFANVAWLSWMSDLVPDGARGGFFASRNFMAGLVTALATVVGGWLAARHLGTALPRHAPYLLLFAMAGVLGLCGAASLARIRHADAPAAPSPEPFWAGLRAPLRSVHFRRFLVFNLCWMSSVHLASPFFQFYLLQDLQLDIDFLALTNTVATLSGLTSIRLWGALCDRYGSKPVLYVTLAFAAVVPAFYLVSTAENAYWIILSVQLMSGAAWAGLSLAAANLLLRLAPREKNSTYLSTFGALSGAGTALAPILSGIVSQAAAGWQVDIGGLHLYHFKFMFVVSLVARVASIFLLVRIPEPNERSAGEVVRALGSWRTVWSISGLELVHTYLIVPVQRRMLPPRPATGTRPLPPPEGGQIPERQALGKVPRRGM